MSDSPYSSFAGVSFDPARLSPAQLDGHACVVCGGSALTADSVTVPVGSVDGAQVFACEPCVPKPAPTQVAAKLGARTFAIPLHDSHAIPADDGPLPAPVGAFFLLVEDLTDHEQDTLLGRLAQVADRDPDVHLGNALRELTEAIVKARPADACTTTRPDVAAEALPRPIAAADIRPGDVVAVVEVVRSGEPERWLAFHAALGEVGMVPTEDLHACPVISPAFLGRDSGHLVLVERRGGGQ